MGKILNFSRKTPFATRKYQRNFPVTCGRVALYFLEINLGLPARTPIYRRRSGSLSPGSGGRTTCANAYPRDRLLSHCSIPETVASDQNYLKGSSNEYRHCEMVQRPAGLWLYPA